MALDMLFEEDDPTVARMLRAATRLGEDGAEIVGLFGDEARVFLDRARTKPGTYRTAFHDGAHAGARAGAVGCSQDRAHRDL
jgi:hypothetical protein